MGREAYTAVIAHERYHRMRKSQLIYTPTFKNLCTRCLACISKIAVTTEIANNKLIRVPLRNFECKRNFYMIYHKDKYRSELFEKFVSFTQDMMKKMIKRMDSMDERLDLILTAVESDLR